MKLKKIIAFVSCVAMMFTNATISASATNYSSILIGDVNLDGTVRANDLLLLKQHIVEISALEGDTVLQAANCNGDDFIDVRDLLLLYRYILRIISDDEFTPNDGTIPSPNDVPQDSLLDGKECTFDIGEIELYFDKLDTYSSDGNGNYIVSVPIFCENNTDYGISALKLSFSQDMSFYPKSSSEFGIVTTENFEDAFDLSVGANKLIYTDAKNFVETDGVMCYVDVLIPSDCKLGDKYPLKFDLNGTNYFVDTENEDVFAPTLKNGYVKIAGSVSGVKNIQLNATGGTCDYSYISVREEPNPTYSLPIPTREGESYSDLCGVEYSFSGWYTEEFGGIEITDNDSNILEYDTLYAHWDEINWDSGDFLNPQVTTTVDETTTSDETTITDETTTVEENPYHYDVNNDGKINVIDLLDLKKKILGIVK